MSARPSLSALALGAAVATALAAPATAFGVAAPHHPTGHHHHKGHHHGGVTRHHHKSHHRSHHVRHAGQPVAVDGLVSAVHRHGLSVLATSARVGHHHAAGTVVHVSFVRGSGHAAHHHSVQRGDAVHLVGRGTGSLRHLVVRALRHEHVAPSPATTVVGDVERVEGDTLLVSQVSRDDGHHGRGWQRHLVRVDVSSAAVTEDGEAGKVHVGDLVAVLGEASGDTVLAQRVSAFSSEPDVMRGRVTAVDGDTVTLRSDGYDTTVDLSGVPLFLNGSAVDADQLRVHDKLLVLGVVSEEEEGFVPVLGFAFNGHDDGPCGDNPEPGHHHGH